MKSFKKEKLLDLIIECSGNLKVLQNSINLINNGLVKFTSHASSGSLLNINPFDLVVCNLYPFKKVISGNHTQDDAIENIDIGGVTLIRSSFKNYKYVY